MRTFIGCVLCVQGAVRDKDVPVEGVQFFLSRHNSQQVGLPHGSILMCVHVWVRVRGVCVGACVGAYVHACIFACVYSIS